MTDEEILNLLRKKCPQIFKDADLTDKDVIIKKDQHLSKQEIAQHGFTSLEVVKKTKELVIMVGKKGLKVVKIVVLLWTVTQIGSVLVFNKRLPDAVDLAQHFRQGLIERAHDIREQEPDIPETWIVISPSLERFDDAQYKNMAYEYLSGKRPPEELYAINTQFIATTGMSIETINSTSSDSKDFV